MILASLPSYFPQSNASSITSLSQALEVAQAGEAAHPQACLQLMAQLHYRLGQSKDTIKAYDKLFKEHKVREDLVCHQEERDATTLC